MTPMRASRLAFSLVALPARLVAQGSGEIGLARLPYPIRLDGVLTDSTWSAVAPLPLTLYAPVFRGMPTERTEIRVAYDDEYLYASGWFYDSRPGEIRVNSLYRDRWSGDDTFALFVDAFNDNETGLWFGTTPAGIRIDQSIGADARVSGSTTSRRRDHTGRCESRRLL
jgi:hypothetical protein